MKKNLFLLGTLLLGATMFVSCGSDGDDNPTPAPKPTPSNSLEGSYFTVDGNSTYSDTGLPSATGDAALGEVTMNTTATNGGMNVINVQAPQRMSQFHVGVTGVDGHITLNADDYLASAPRAKVRTLRTMADTYTYNIPMLYSTELPHNNFNIMICGTTAEGEVTATVTQPVSYIETLEGDLKVTLTFYAEKDVDLHLYTPSGRHIYFGDRDGGYLSYEDYYEEYDGEEPTGDETLELGLDVDSNAGCTIDGIKIENIFIPAQYLEAGEYTVIVDMWENCTPWGPSTPWSCVAYFQGNIITPTWGNNPAYGEYAFDCGDGDMTEVMKFVITEATATKARNGAPLLTPKPLRRSFKDRAKLLEREDF